MLLDLIKSFIEHKKLTPPPSPTRVRLSVVRTPEDRFEGLEGLGYKFAPHYVELPIGGGKTLPRVHYIDEGTYSVCSVRVLGVGKLLLYVC